MNHFRNLLLLLISISIINGCLRDNQNYDFTYETIVTEVPVNLEEINSVYDDYNSALPYPAGRYGIYFSTNRKSAGGNFDFIYKAMDISYHSRDDVLNISHVSTLNTNDRLEFLVDETATDYDEFGPYPFWATGDYEYFLYANNENEDFDIKYASLNKSDENDYAVNQSFTSLNSEFDDFYPCISEDLIYFCSNREDDRFDIYSTIFNQDEIDPSIQETVNNPIERNTILSSDEDDKCPYIEDDIMVFTSDRDGGFGGFDLYYSKRVDGEWTEAINFGPTINSESDEYRPIIIPFFEFEEIMLVFSSNREGGKGGFDLYSVRAGI